jgi:hypothetical protein
MYEHGIATFALAEACAVAAAMGRAPDERYIEAARKAVDFIEKMQYRDGGWRYWDDPGRAGDTSVTGWQVLALKTAKEAGIPVSEECVAGIRKFFASRETGKDGQTGYDTRHPVTQATTGVGMLAQQFLLGQPNGPLVRDAAEFLADYAEKHWSDREAQGQHRDFYLWYNCTLAMFQAGGEPWERWNPPVRDTIIRLQRHDGCARGSWDPSSKWGSPGGRIYTTALAALTLEVYYRYASHEEAEDAFGATVSAIDGFEEMPGPDAAELGVPEKSSQDLPERREKPSDDRPSGELEVRETPGLRLREDRE